MQHTAVPNANVLLEIRIFLKTVDVREGASSDSCASCRERCWIRVPVIGNVAEYVITVYGKQKYNVAVSTCVKGQIEYDYGLLKTKFYERQL